MLLHIGLTFLVAVLFGFVCLKLKIPGGMLVGAILGVASLNIFTGMAVMPYPAKFTAQATAGAFIGFQVKRDDLSRMKALLRPALLMLTCMMLTNLVVGFGIYAVGTMDLVTAMMCAVPGGMGDTPLIAADMGANAGQVVVMQFVRMCFGIGVFPSVIVAFNRRLHAGMSAETCAAVCLDDEDKPRPASRQSKGWKAALYTGAAALSGGLLGRWTGVPAGVLMFSMFFTIAFNLKTGKAGMPFAVKRVAQTLSGAYIGCGIGYADIIQMRFLVLPVIILMTGYMLNCLAVGTMMRRFFGIEAKEAYLIGTPAGASDMALISSDMGVNSTNLVVLQVIRAVSVLSFFPQLIALVVHLAG